MAANVTHRLFDVSDIVRLLEASEFKSRMRDKTSVNLL